MGRFTWILRALVVAQVVQLVMMVPLAAPKSARDFDEHLSIPVRWCAVRGSPAVEKSPKATGLTTDTILRGRHGRATAYVWMPEARISFRSALSSDLPGHVGFPLIEDPRPPRDDGSGGPGMDGDILDPHLDRAKLGELNAVLAGCEQAWEHLEDQFGMNLQGIVLVNIRRFVKPDGTPSQLLGVGASMHTVPYGTDKCEVPSNLAAYDHLGSNNGWVVIADNLFTVGSDPNDSVLAHELGHVLFLGHGNGKDDPLGSPPRTNQRFDSFCDNHEDIAASPATLMWPKGPTPNRLTKLQRASARAAARVTEGGMHLQVGDQRDGYVLSDDEVDKIGEVGDPSVDLRSLGIIYDTVEGTTTLNYRLLGKLPQKPGTHRFLVFSDEDLNTSTGGQPATLGFPTLFEGAEYVSRVEVETQDAGRPPRVRATVWEFGPRGFVALPQSKRVTANVNTLVVGDQGQWVHDVVSVQFPHDLVDKPNPEKVRFQAIVERIGGEVDRLPEEPDRGRIVRLTPPTYRACRPNPYKVVNGGEFKIEATGFDPGKQAEVLLDEEKIGKGIVDSRGNLSLQLSAPSDSKDGLHLLVVTERGKATTAHCVLTVTREPTRKKASGKKAG